MAWGESKNWLKGKANERLYQGLLEDASGAPARNEGCCRDLRAGS